MKRVATVLSFFQLFIFINHHPAYAGKKTHQNTKQHENIYNRGEGGGEVPTPFNAVNQRFELADGEVYLLAGRILVLPSLEDDSGQPRAYFNLDLDRAPWLGNVQRTKLPYYPLEGSIHEWKSWNHFPVKMLCRAHGQIVEGKNGLEYIISLEPVY